MTIFQTCGINSYSRKVTGTPEVFKFFTRNLTPSLNVSSPQAIHIGGIPSQSVHTEGSTRGWQSAELSQCRSPRGGVVGQISSAGNPGCIHGAPSDSQSTGLNFSTEGRANAKSAAGLTNAQPRGISTGILRPLKVIVAFSDPRRRDWRKHWRRRR